MEKMVNPFSAEKTLTRDTVPVDVDTVLFWMVWDAEKAALEVEEYRMGYSYWLFERYRKEALAARPHGENG